MFNAAQKAWNKIEPEVQQALIKGSGVIAIINENLDKTPEFVFELIQQKFPGLTKEALQDGLKQVKEAFKIADDVEQPDLLTTIKNIQE